MLEQAQALGVQSLPKCCEKPILKFDNKSLGLEQWDLKTHNSHNTLSHPFGHVIVLLRAPSLQHSCDFSVGAHSCRIRPARIEVPQQNKSVGAGAPNWGVICYQNYRTSTWRSLSNHPIPWIILLYIFLAKMNHLILAWENKSERQASAVPAAPKFQKKSPPREHTNRPPGSSILPSWLAPVTWPPWLGASDETSKA